MTAIGYTNLHKNIAELVKTYSIKRGIYPAKTQTDVAKMDRIGKKLSEAVDGVLKSVLEAKSRGAAEARTTINHVCLNPKYNEILSNAINLIFNVFIIKQERKYYGYVDYGDTPGSKPYYEFVITWDGASDPVMRPTNMDFSIFSRYREKDQFIDATLSCEGRDFRVHRIVVAPQSEFLEAIFSSQMKEGRSAYIQVNAVDMHSDVQHFEEFVNYLYIGKIELKNRSTQSIAKLLSFACGYLVKDLRHACIQELSQRVTGQNAQEISEIAKKFTIKELYDICDWRKSFPVVPPK